MRHKTDISQRLIVFMYDINGNRGSCIVYGTVLDITDKDGRGGVSISGEHRMIQTTRRESKESKLRIQYSDNATIKF